MKLSVSAYRAHASAHKKILSSYQQHYGSTSAPISNNSTASYMVEDPERHAYVSRMLGVEDNPKDSDELANSSDTKRRKLSSATSKDDEDNASNNESSDSKGQSPGQRTKSNQRWMKLRTTVQLSSAIQKKPPLKREDSFLKRFSTRQIPETQETVEDTGSEDPTGDHTNTTRRRRRVIRAPRTVVNPDENFYFYWLWVITACVLYNMWTLIVRQSFPELQIMCHYFWVAIDGLTDTVFALDIGVQLRTGYLEQGLMVYDSRKLARHYLKSRPFILDIFALVPLDLLQFKLGTQPILRFPRFLKVYRAVHCYYMVESRTVYPNFWRVINLIHILLILAHWFGCFYFLLSQAEGFQGDWVYPHRPGEYATLTRKYLGSLYWSTLTLTTIGDLPTPETNAEYVFTIVSYLIGVFIFATIVGQVGNVITNRNANRLEFERLLDGAKTYMRHHKVPGGMKRRVLRWYDYSWSRGRIQGGGDINTALGLLPDKLKTELALHVNLSVLKKVTIFQECQPEFLHDLVLKMKAYIFTPGDSICRKGEVAREMFIIADGILEVISETGRVLTTMKAGDFFGEIGILNLDGLNKRTADVRSVGYSELFSLSREDVLAAMKDYPEAQEILQTLGRKRLQEARNSSRHRSKEKSPEKAGDDSTSRKVLTKIKSDVKGLRNAIRNRSRVGRRSAGESVELQNLGESSSKGVLRRMPRVESDDYSHTEERRNSSFSKETEKLPSPIGAGLPLLQRLKLLKEKQDKEDKSATKQRYSTGSILPSTSKQQHGQTSRVSEPEVIGAGLPLLQRLLLLKAKEEKEKSKNNLASSNLQSSSETISPCSILSPLSPSFKTTSPIKKDSEFFGTKTQSPTSKTSRKNSSGSSDGCSKPKVSFRDKILQVQSDGTEVTQPLTKFSEDKVSTFEREKEEKPTFLQSITIPNTVVSKIKSPAKVGCSFRDKLKQLQGATTTKETEKNKDEGPLKIKPSNPWSKFKSAVVTVPSGTENKTEINKPLEPDKIEMLNDSQLLIPKESTDDSSVILVEIENNNLKVNNQNASASAYQQTLQPVIQHPITEIDTASESRQEMPRKPLRYSSIDDLSPEYFCLPFVKKLKILNERQEWEETDLPSIIRSTSLECSSSNEDLIDKDSLVRSQSEGSKVGNHRLCITKQIFTESNETLERKRLKSILKKLSEPSTPVNGSPEHKNDFRKLFRSPTVEGYAARHSKFSKSVTFDRHTHQSPPISTSHSSGDIEDLLTPITQEVTNTPEEIFEELEVIRNTETKSKVEFNETFKPIYEIRSKTIVELRPEEIKVPVEKPKIPFISTLANQRKLIRGSLEEQEYFGEVLLGIKQVIQSHLQDVQGKFHDRFINLELEVKQRDEIIEQLQNRIHELEKTGNQSESNDCKQTVLNAKTQESSSGSEELSEDRCFSREDSFDTVFARSPTSTEIQQDIQTRRIIKSDSHESDDISQVSDEAFLAIAQKYDLESMSYKQLKTLARSLLSRKQSCQASQTMELKMGKSETYARRRASKLKQQYTSRAFYSPAHSLDIEETEFNDPLSSSSSRLLSEEHLLLVDSKLSKPSRRSGHQINLFGTHLTTCKGKIKKTLSVDAGMHQNAKIQKIKKSREQRKFSLGSLFGYGRRHTRHRLQSQNSNDVVIDIESNCSWSGESTSSSSGSDSDYLPRTPPFEEFLRKSKSNQGQSSSSSPPRGIVGSGGDWEVMMLAEELNKRERDTQHQIQRNTLRQQHYEYVLNELEEESDTQARQSSPGSPSDHSNSDPKSAPTPSTSQAPAAPQRQQSSEERQHGIILRAASLDSPRPCRRDL